MNNPRILVQLAQFKSHIMRDFWNPPILTRRKICDRIVLVIKRGDAPREKIITVRSLKYELNIFYTFGLFIGDLNLFLNSFFRLTLYAVGVIM